jgi:hypothetical protein
MWSQFMEILNQNQQEIVIGRRPPSMKERIIRLFTSVFLLSIPGVIGLSSGIPRIVSEMGLTKLTCDRITLTQVNCQLSTSHYFGLRTQPTSSYKFVKSAIVHQAEEKTNMTMNDKPITYTNYWLGFQTQRGEEIVLETRDSDLVDNLDNRLNSFLKSQQQSFKLVRDTRFDLNLKVNHEMLTFFLVFLGTFGLLGVVGVLSVFYSGDITINKSQNLMIHRQTLFGWTKRSRSPLSDILEIKVNAVTDSDDDTSYRVLITFRSQRNQIFPMGEDVHGANQLAAQLGNFLGLPFVAHGGANP